MKKEIIYKTALHEIQEKLFNLIAKEDIGDLTLREIGEKVNVKFPQQIDHHLNQLLKHGFVNMIDGKYEIAKRFKTN